jgi:hypothetical protein
MFDVYLFGSSPRAINPMGLKLKTGILLCKIDGFSNDLSDILLNAFLNFPQTSFVFLQLAASDFKGLLLIKELIPGCLAD